MLAINVLSINFLGLIGIIVGGSFLIQIDDENNCTYYIDAEGGESCYWYNKDYVVTKTRDALGNITESEWDYGQRVAQTDALGRETRYDYNSFGDISKVTLPDGNYWSYSYNDENQLTGVRNSKGEQTQYQWDVFD